MGAALAIDEMDRSGFPDLYREHSAKSGQAPAVRQTIHIATSVPTLFEPSIPLFVEISHFSSTRYMTREEQKILKVALRRSAKVVSFAFRKTQE